MINLPNNWQDSVRIHAPTKTLYLHLVNDARQYFTYYQVLDPAFTMEATLIQIPARAEGGNAYQLGDKMATKVQEPRDQNWMPAPLPFAGIISLEQYLRNQVKE